jgi:hypothetical protein
MSDPARLSVSSGDDVERRLLRAARTGAPAGARQRALVAASSALAASSLTAGGAAAGGAAKAGTAAILKWLGIAGVTGTAALAGAIMLGEPREHAPSSRRSIETTMTASAPPSPATATTAAAVNPAPTASTVAAAPSTPAAPVAPPPKPVASGPVSTTATEVVALDETRQALTEGAPARALSILDRYAARFPRGAMAQEAAVLRIEALVRAGDVASARRAAASFCAAHPDSPYVARVQSLIAGDAPTNP